MILRFTNHHSITPSDIGAMNISPSDNSTPKYEINWRPSVANTIFWGIRTRPIIVDQAGIIALYSNLTWQYLS